MWDALLQDVRYAVRRLRGSPGFTAAAILTLTFGIGANTAMFSVLNALVLRQLPIKDADRLIGVSGRDALDQPRLTPISVVDELTREEGPLQDICAYNGGVVLAVEANGAPTQAIGAFVSGACFATFGVTPFLGRPIVEDDAPVVRPGNHVAVIGHRFWTRMFGADPRAIGRIIRSEGVDLTVIGVLPPAFGGLHADAGADVFAPFDTIFPARADRRPGASHILGRLRPGLSLEQAATELATRWPALLDVAVPPTLPPSERADLRNVRPKVERVGTGLSFYRDQYSRPLTIIIGLTGALLLLACLNLGGLLLARVAARGPELAIRLALGGSRRRIAQQILVETFLLSFAASFLAIPTAFAIVALLASFLPRGLVDRTVTFTPDLRVLAVTALVGLSVGILTGALPVWIAARRRPSAAFTWDRTIAGSTNRWTRGLLVSQVALSVVLLICAALLVRSLYLLQRVDLGVRQDNVLTVRVMPVPNGYRDINNASYYPALMEKLAALPGVRSVGFARLFPRLTTDTLGQPIAFVGDPPGTVHAVLETTSPGFFATVGIALLRGRLTSWSDTETSMQVAVVSESLARALAPNGDALGRRVRFGSDRAHQDVVIIGIVRNATLGNPREPAPPVFYRPALQTGRYANYPSVVIATDGNVAAVSAGVRRVLREAGREYAHDIDTLDEVLTRAPASERMSATVAGGVAGLAVVLALIGIHGLLAYTVSRRTREIGVRVAVGATPASVVRMVLRDGVTVTLIGLALGVPLAYLSARALRTLLFGLAEADVPTLAGTTAFFLLLGLTAGVIPARRAARVDPLVALKTE